MKFNCISPLAILLISLAFLSGCMKQTQQEELQVEETKSPELFVSEPSFLNISAFSSSLENVDVAEIKKQGANAVSLVLGAPFTLPASALPASPEKIKEGQIRDAKKIIKKAKENDLYLELMVDIPTMRETEELDYDVLLEESLYYILDYASLAESEHVPMFTVVTEVNNLPLKRNDKNISDFIQDLREEVRRVYSGKLGIGIDPCRGKRPENCLPFDYNVTGYDYVAISVYLSKDQVVFDKVEDGKIEGLKECYVYSVEKTKEMASKHGVKKVILRVGGWSKEGKEYKVPLTFISLNSEEERELINWLEENLKQEVWGFTFFYGKKPRLGVQPPQIERPGMKEPILKTTYKPQREESEIKERWEEEKVVIPGKYADADVVRLDDGRLRIYYSLEPEVPGFEGQVYSAVSSDGITWTKEEGIRMKWATFPSVIKLSDPKKAPKLPSGKIAKWRMYFQGFTGGSSHKHPEIGIMSAISEDGLNWVREDGFRIKIGQQGEYDTKHVASPTVIELPDGTFLMVYRGSAGQNRFGKVDPKTGKPAPIDYLISATSSDGLNWIPKSIVVDSRNEEMRDQIDGPELVLDGDTIKLYCNSYAGVYVLTLDKNGSALTSPKIVLRARGYHAPSDVTVIKINDTWRMYFGIHTKGIFTARRVE